MMGPSSLEHRGIFPAAFVDTRESAMERLHVELGVDKARCHLSLKQALKKSRFEAATICVPNPGRVPLVEDLLKRGIPCLIEKPAAHTAKDLRRLARAQRKSGATLMVAQNYRFLSAATHIEKLIRSKKAGPLRNISFSFCRREPFLADGFYANLSGPHVIALELGCHHIDLLNFFTGSLPRTIYGKTWRLGSFF